MFSTMLVSKECEQIVIDWMWRWPKQGHLSSLRLPLIQNNRISQSIDSIWFQTFKFIQSTKNDRQPTKDEHVLYVWVTKNNENRLKNFHYLLQRRSWLVQTYDWFDWLVSEMLSNIFGRRWTRSKRVWGVGPERRHD